MINQFWNKKKVFVTGHTGFKGSWLTLWLRKMGADVTGYSLAPSTQPNLFEQAAVSNGIHSVIGDIRNLTELKNAVEQSKPEIVFHLAAQPLVPYSYQNPVETYEVNVMGTVNLLEAIRLAGNSVRVVIVVTSDKCYENHEWVWGYRETDQMGGYDPYSNSKGCAELVASAYRRSYFSNNNSPAIATVRAGNVIGGGDWSPTRLIPDLIRAFTKKEIAMIRSPHSFRPWQYVLDLLKGYLMVAEYAWENRSKYSEAWNFGPTSENIQPVSWVADKVVSLFQNGAQWKLYESQRPIHESTSLKLDCSKSWLNLSWMPKMSLSETIEETVAWYRADTEKKEMEAFSLGQIRSYEKKWS